MRLLPPALVVLSLCALTTPLDAQSSLKGAWGFEEATGTAAADSSGSGNTGMLLNVPTWTTGRIGGGLSFDGVDDRVQVADSASIDITSNITVEAWVKLTSDKPWHVVLSKESPDADHSYALWITPSKWVHASFVLSDGTRGLSTPTAIPLNVWTHVAATYDGATMRLYLDGVQVGMTAATGSFADTTGPFWIGGDQWAGDYFGGLIDEVRVYDRALSAAEIRNDATLPVDPAAALQVTAVSPASGAVGVRNASLSATFSAAMVPATLTASTIVLELVGGNAVEATRSYDAAARTITLTPTTPLTPLTVYRLRVVGGSGGVADTSNRTLDADRTWTFTSAAGNGLSGAWGFGEGTGAMAADASGNGNIGALLGPSWTTGRFGNGLSFDGINDRVQIPDSDTAEATTALTLSAWFKLTGDKPWNVILLKDFINGQHSFAIWTMPTGYLTANFVLNGVWKWVNSPMAIPLDVWTHVAVTYDGAAIVMYVDGAEVGTTSASGAFANTDGAFWIGGDRYPEDYFLGLIDEVRLYDRALSTADIQFELTQPVQGASGLQVTSVTPAPGRLGVRATPIAATFSEAMNAASITATTVVLEAVAGGTVTATRGYDALSRTLTMAPTSALSPLTAYRVTIVGGAGGVSSVSAAALPSNVVWTFTTAAPNGVGALWGFEENGGTSTADGSGNGNTGTVQGPTWTAGRFGRGLSFDGVNDRIQVSDAETLDLTTAATLSAWIKLTSPVTASGTILVKEHPEANWAYTLRLNSYGWIQGYIRTDTGLHMVQLTSPLPVGEWIHVAATYDGSMMRLFVNGELRATQPATGAILTTARSLWLGANDSGSDRFAGLLDEVRLYGYAQTITEIQSDMVAPITLLPPPTPVLSVPSGTYSSDQAVVVTVDDVGAAIHYTQNGVDPTESDPTVVSGASLLVSSTQMLKARAFKPGTAPSDAAVASYVLKVGLPSLSPFAGNYDAPQTVSISPSAGVTWRYTTNGTNPTSTSPIYADPVAVNGATTFRIVGFKTGWSQSDVAVRTYTVDIVAPTIIARRFPSPLNGWHLTPVTVSFGCSDNIAVGSCSAPTPVNLEGTGYTVTGTVVDTAGRQATIVETVNLDLTAPEVTLTAPADMLVTTATTIAVTGEVSDALSGLLSVMCNGVAASVVDGQVSCTVSLRPGRNAIALAARDAAGNSTSAGVTVMRVGTATQITLMPQSRSMVVNEEGTLSLLDNFGAVVSGATWSSSDTNVVSLSADDPPLLTALASGSVTILADQPGLSSAFALLTVVAGESFPEGTIQWTVPPLPTPNLRRDAPIYTHRIDATGPDAFMVETNTGTWERTVRPVAIGSGEVPWMMAAPGVPLFGDAFGGLVAGVEPSPNTCRPVFNEVERCYQALARFAGPANTLSWRYESPGTVDRPAQGPDGTIYVIEHVFGAISEEKTLVVLDGATGRVTARVPLANSVTDTTVTNVQSSCQNSHSESAPLTVGPMVGGDGFGYLLVSQRTRTIQMACGSGWVNGTFTSWQNTVGQTTDVSFRLLRLSPQGQVAAEVLDGRQCATECAEPRPKQLLPDGIGGLLIVAEHRLAPTFTPQLRVTRLDDDGGRVDTPLLIGTRIELIGQAGTAYLHRKTSSTTSVAKNVVDVQTWATKWTMPLQWSWLAASPDGGAVAQDANGQLARFDGLGQLIGTTPLALTSPVQEFSSWVGNTTSGLRAIAGQFDDATRFDATYVKVGSSSEEPKTYGGRHSDLQMRRAGVGIWVKWHQVNPAFPFLHLSIRVTPGDGLDWKSHPVFGSYFTSYIDGDGNARPAVDEFGNVSATLGAGPPPPGDATTFCATNSVLVSRPNRPGDQERRPLYQVREFLRSTAEKDALISLLFNLDANYRDNSPYECFPEPDKYNSNSYAIGLWSAAGRQLHPYIRGFAALFPGYTRPLPASVFQPQ